MRRWRWWLFILAVLWLSVRTVLAHGYILRSIPEDRSTLERPPTRLQYWFSEDLEAQFSTLVLRDANGQVIAEGGVDPENPTLLTLKLPPNSLAQGAYVVELRPAFSSDGHASLSTQVFFVGEAVGDIASVASNPSAQPLEVLWKTLLLSGTFLLFGVYMLYSYVLIPAWGNPKYVQGQLPPRVMQRLNGLVWVGLVASLIGNLLALLQQSMVFFNATPEQVLTGGLWDVVRIGSRFGDVWNVRMIFLGIAFVLHLASLLYRERYPRSVKGFWGAGTWCLSLIIGAQAVTSHGAGSLVMPWVAVAMHWLHSLATAFWVGGMVALVWVVPIAIQPYTDAQRQQAVASVMRAFSRLMVGALAVVIASGMYNASNWFFAPSDLQSTYGGALALKIVLTALLLAFGLAHHLALHPHLAQRVAQQPLVTTLTQWAGRFGNSLRLEAVVAVAVLVCASLLSSTPIPQPSFLSVKVPPVTQTTQQGAYDVTLTIAPGGVGVNTYDVVVLKDGAPADDLQVELQFSQPERDTRGLVTSLEALGDGLYGSSNNDLSRLGKWWASLDLIGSDGTITRVAFDLAITAESTVVKQVNPSWLTLLAGFAVVGALAIVVYPSAQALYQQLDLSPMTVGVAVGVVGISVGMLVFSGWYLNEQNTQQEALLNPLPSRVNPTLPDEASLERGKDLYYEQCVIWQSVTDFGVFVKQLDRLRDDVVYSAVQQGWRKMPACDGTLTPEQTWDVVNFVRTLQRQFRKE